MVLIVLFQRRLINVALGLVPVVSFALYISLFVEMFAPNIGNSIQRD